MVVNLFDIFIKHKQDITYNLYQMNKNLLIGLVALMCVGTVLYNQQSTQQPD
jgi:hypothetical protein